MRLLYFDCIAGISGDMALGALIDAGADLEPIRSGPRAAPGRAVRARRRGGGDAAASRATKVHVRTSTDGLIRTYASIRSLLDMAEMPLDAKAMAQRIFRRLAEAEAMVHRTRPRSGDVPRGRRRRLDRRHRGDGARARVAEGRPGVRVGRPDRHGHGQDRARPAADPRAGRDGAAPRRADVLAQRLGRARHAHGRGDPRRRSSRGSASCPTCGSSTSGTAPGARAWTSRTWCASWSARRSAIRSRAADETPPGTELVLETNVDDLNPELYSYVLERLFAAGAQDAWLTPIVMKKGRPAVTISVLVSPSRQEAVRQVLFRETGTLGIRASLVDKQALDREWVEVATQHGSVRVKIGRLEGNAVTRRARVRGLREGRAGGGRPGARRLRGSDPPGARGDRRVKLILLVIAAALIVGLLTGGSFRYFPSIPLGWWSLAIGGHRPAVPAAHRRRRVLGAWSRRSCCCWRSRCSTSARRASS